MAGRIPRLPRRSRKGAARINTFSACNWSRTALPEPSANGGHAFGGCGRTIAASPPCTLLLHALCVVCERTCEVGVELIQPPLLAARTHASYRPRPRRRPINSFIVERNARALPQRGVDAQRPRHARMPSN